MSHIGKNIKTICSKWGMKGPAFRSLFPFKISSGKLSSYNTGTNPPMKFMIHLEKISGVAIIRLYEEEIDIKEVSDHPLKPHEWIVNDSGSSCDPKTAKPNIYDEIELLKKDITELKTKIN